MENKQKLHNSFREGQDKRGVGGLEMLEEFKKRVVGISGGRIYALKYEKILL